MAKQTKVIKKKYKKAVEVFKNGEWQPFFIIANRNDRIDADGYVDMFPNKFRIIDEIGEYYVEVE
jgi:hypothetical protein